MKKSLKKFLIFIIGMILLCSAGCLSLTVSMKKSLSKIQNTDINMKNVSDGTYNGHSELGPVVVDVEVQVKNHRIKKVNLVRHDCGLGHPADVIVDKMVEMNTYNVDAVSGATVSSEIIKNAVNKALADGL